MHASTARACLRKLSDWVNSVSKLQAASRSFTIFSWFSPVFMGVISVIMGLIYVFHSIFLLTLHHLCRTLRLRTKLVRVVSALALPPIHGHYVGACRLTRSRQVRPLQVSPVSHFQQSLPPLQSEPGRR